jgi:hypothetical protein
MAFSAFLKMTSPLLLAVGMTFPAMAQIAGESDALDREATVPAEKVEQRAVVLGTLDKITARVSNLDVPINQSVRFGTLEITARSCNSTPPEEAPETSAFLEIREIKRNEDPTSVFSGWMFASSPALSAMEHPVYDVWVLSCTTLSPETEEGSAKKSASPDTAAPNNP